MKTDNSNDWTCKTCGKQKFRSHKGNLVCSRCPDSEIADPDMPISPTSKTRKGIASDSENGLIGSMFLEYCMKQMPCVILSLWSFLFGCCGLALLIPALVDLLSFLNRSGLSLKEVLLGFEMSGTGAPGDFAGNLEWVLEIQTANVFLARAGAGLACLGVSIVFDRYLLKYRASLSS